MPKFRLLVIFAFCAITAIGFPQLAGHAAQRPLSRFYYKNRILIVYAPKANDPRFLREWEFLEGGSAAGFKERQLIVFHSLAYGQKYDVARSRSLRALYHIAPATFRVTLIGKDGITAYSSSVPVSPEKIFSEIDRMPMRRDEMRHPASH